VPWKPIRVALADLMFSEISGSFDRQAGGRPSWVAIQSVMLTSRVGRFKVCGIWLQVTALSSKHRVLVVDDEAGVGRIIKAAAAELGLQALAITDSEQFDQAFASITPTIIFLDIIMPGRDGMEIVRQLGTQGYTGQIVLITGSNPLYMQMTSSVAWAHGLGLIGMLFKPFRKRQVVDLLTELTKKPLGAVSYRCLLLENDRIVGIELIEASTDAAALEKAREHLAGSSFTTLELWAGSRRVGIVDNR
jgi:DNA-binding response OmpR family regulator